MSQENKRDVSKFDLNLLATFETIYTTRSVTRAAEVMNRAPSSVSSSLQKLRDFFADPLFIRQGGILTPSAVATDIYTRLQKTYGGLMYDLESLTQGESKSVLKVHCPTYVALHVLPVIVRWLEENAPQCRVIHRDFLRNLDTPEDLLQRRGVDLLFDVFPSQHFALETVPLYQEDCAFICRKDHPRLGSSISKEEAMQETFAIFESEGVDVKLGRLNIFKQLGERTHGAGSTSLLAIAAIVEQSDLICNVPTWIYKKFHGSFDIRTLEQSFDPNIVTTYMMYHKNSLNNEMVAELAGWLKQHFEGHSEG